MLVVRDIFIARPGQASKLAKLMLEVLTEESNGRVLTDFVSTHNTVIVEMEIESLDEFTKRVEKRPTYSAKLRDAGYADMFYTGRREILEVFKP